MTTPNVADALQGLLDAGWTVRIWPEDEQPTYGLYVECRSMRFQFYDADLGKLVLKAWAEALGE